MFGGLQDENRISAIVLKMSAIGCKFKCTKKIMLRMQPYFARSTSSIIDCVSSTAQNGSKLKLTFETNFKFNNVEEVKHKMGEIFQPPSEKLKQGQKEKGDSIHFGYIIDECSLTYKAGNFLTSEFISLVQQYFYILFLFRRNTN